MKLFRQIVSLVFSAWMCLASACAATYYVSPAGSDWSAGTSPAQAWKTLERANQAKLQGGDSVLLQRGGVWHEQLELRGGRPGAPVTYGAYGSGSVPPILDGADVIAGMRPVGGNVFRAPFKGKLGKVLLGTDYLNTQVPLAPAASRDEMQAKQGTFFQEGDSLLLHLAPSAGSAPVVEVTTPARRYAIENRGGSYLVVQDLALVRTYNSALISRPATSNHGADHIDGSEITVQRCFLMNYGSPTDLQHGDYPEDAGEAGIYIEGFHDSPLHAEQALPGVRVLDNKVGRFDSHGTIDYDRAGIQLRNTTGAIVRGNRVVTETAMGIHIADNYNNGQNDTALVEGNDLSLNQGNISIAGCKGCRLQKNNIHDSAGYGVGLGRGFFAPSDRPQLIENVITRLRPSEGNVLYNGVDCNAGTKNGLAKGNHISAVANDSFTLESSEGNACSGWTFEDNVFDARQNVTFQGKPAGRVGCLFVQKPSMAGLVMRNNHFEANPAWPKAISYGADSAADLTHLKLPSEVPH